MSIFLEREALPEGAFRTKDECLCGAGTLPRKRLNIFFEREALPEGAFRTKDECLCGAEVAHSLGKGEATGSNPVKGNF